MQNRGRDEVFSFTPGFSLGPRSTKNLLRPIAASVPRLKPGVNEKRSLGYEEHEINSVAGASAYDDSGRQSNCNRTTRSKIHDHNCKPFANTASSSWITFAVSRCSASAFTGACQCRAENFKPDEDARRTPKSDHRNSTQAGTLPGYGWR